MPLDFTGRGVTLQPSRGASSIEDRLTQALEQLNARYADALQVVEPLRETVEAEVRDQGLERMQRLMQGIATVEVQSQPLRASIRAAL